MSDGIKCNHGTPSAIPSLGRFNFPQLHIFDTVFRPSVLVVVGHYFIWHAQVLTDVDIDAVVSGQQQVTVKGEHMNVAQKSVMVLCQQVDRSPC